MGIILWSCTASCAMNGLKAILLLLIVLWESEASPHNDDDDGFESLNEDNFIRGRSLDIKNIPYSGMGGPIDPPHDAANDGKESGSAWHGRGALGYWPRGEIPYRVKGFSRDDRDQIASAIEYIQSVTCLRFVPARNGYSLPRMDIIEFYDGGACECRWWNKWEGIYARIHLTPNSECTLPRTIVHEIMHAGFFPSHTHQRTDRDRNIIIRKENIIPNRRDQFHTMSNTKYMDCDCSSVMHYASDQWSRNGRNTIEPKSPNCKLLRYRQWNRHLPMMSRQDIKHVQKYH